MDYYKGLTVWESEGLKAIPSLLLKAYIEDLISEDARRNPKKYKNEFDIDFDWIMSRTIPHTMHIPYESIRSAMKCAVLADRENRKDKP